jgi:hypothetical protein
MSVFHIICILALLDISSSFSPLRVSKISPAHCRSVFNVIVEAKGTRSASKLRLNSFVDISSTLIAIGDYAAEIEKGVGEEIYAPIFKSGLVLFGSGLISAFMAAAIIAKSDSWEELGLEFERGKIAQLIELDVNTDNAVPSAAETPGSIPSAPVVAVAPQPTKKEEIRVPEIAKSNSDGVYDLDI